MSVRASGGPFRIEFRAEGDLPRLSWCAELRRGDPTVRVLHGSWVETGPDSFVEGAWDGPWSERAFDRAVTFVGSGGRLAPDGIVFAPPSHNLDRIVSVRVGDALWFSNSLVFALVRSGLELDLGHRDYFFDMLAHYRSGVTGRVKALRTATPGHELLLYDCVNARVARDLTVSVEAKDYGTAPTGYHEYVASLQVAVERTIANAADPERARRYRPLTSVSRGYDSAAVSVLAARAGCTSAVTFTRSGHRKKGQTRYLEDDGHEIAAVLGLSVTEYDRKAILEGPPPEHADFYVNPYFSTEVVTPMMNESVEGTIWMSGRHGEQFWDTDPAASQPWYRDPVSTSLGGANSMELRLRMGYLHFPVPYTRGVHAPALNRISRSAAMTPWSVGGSYDRPIARRLLEEAGVRREAFGQIKMGGGDDGHGHRTVPSGWEEELLAFVQERVAPGVRARLLGAGGRSVPHFKHHKMPPVERWLRTRPLVRHVTPILLGDRHHPRWRSVYLYAFHWGVERLRERYAVAG